MRQEMQNRLAIGAVTIAGVAGLAAWLAHVSARGGAQVTYPPLDRPKPLADNVWVVDSGPISASGLKMPVRMTVVRLQDGELLLHSPTRYTNDLGMALDALGKVRHLVAPTIGHWMFMADWQRAYPDATVWATPALRDRAQVRRSGLRIDADLLDTAPVAWAGEIEQGLVSGGIFEEAWLFHKPSRTLLLTDLIQNLETAKLPPVTAVAMRAARATDATSALHVRALLALGGAETRKAIGAMLTTEPDRVVFAHGNIFAENGAQRLKRAFAWAV